MNGRSELFIICQILDPISKIAFGNELQDFLAKNTLPDEE